jgi:hypothetical protein
MVAECCRGMEFVHSRLYSLSTLQYVCAIMDHGPWFHLLCSIKMLQVYYYSIFYISESNVTPSTIYWNWSNSTGKFILSTYLPPFSPSLCEFLIWVSSLAYPTWPWALTSLMLSWWNWNVLLLLIKCKTEKLTLFWCALTSLMLSCWKN